MNVRHCVPAVLLLALLLALPGCSRSELYVDGSADGSLLPAERAQAPMVPLPCIALEPGAQVRRLVSARVAPTLVDVLFLLDNTASMLEEFAEIRRRLQDTIVPAIRARTEDTQFGVAIVSDFPVVGHHAPYQLLQAITPDADAVLAALNSAGLEFGGDDPEAQLEGLFQVATGDGLTGSIDASPACPHGSHAGACFRDQSFALVMLFTDAPMRNVAGLLADGSIATSVIDDEHESGRPKIPYVRKYDETIAALQAEHIRVVGLWSGLVEGLDDLRRVATDTGALDADGRPVLFDIGRDAKSLGEGTVSALDLARSGKHQSVQLTLVDGDPDDGVDTPLLVTAVRAVSVVPADRAQPDGERFVAVEEGAQLTFELTIDTGTLSAAQLHMRYPITLLVEASDGTLLSTQTIDLLVGIDGC